MSKSGMRVCVAYDDVKVETLAASTVTRGGSVTLIQFSTAPEVAELVTDRDGAQWVEFDLPQDATGAIALERWLEANTNDYTYSI